MAAAMGMIGGCAGAKTTTSASWLKSKERLTKNKKDHCRNGNRNRVYSSATRLADPYETLRVDPRASESDVKKAFRRLALQYHPDVCKGENCGVQFHRINDAYDIVMSNLRGDTATAEIEAAYEYDPYEPLQGMNEPDWDMWEEWMGWEGAGIRDYSSHINPYT